MNINFNDIGEIITFDTFLQGLFFMICLSVGCAMFFTDSLKKKKKQNGTKSRNDIAFPTPLDKAQIQSNESQRTDDPNSMLTDLNLDIKSLVPRAINLFLGFFIKKLGDADQSAISKVSIGTAMFSVIVFMSLTSGIFVNSVAEVWIEETGIEHMGARLLWGPEDGEIQKINAFDKVYNYPDNNGLAFDSISNDDKVQFYHFASHEVLKNDIFKGRLNSSRLRSDYAQTFAMSFFVLYIFAWMNLLSLQFRSFIFRMDLALQNSGYDAKKNGAKAKISVIVAKSFYYAIKSNPIFVLGLVLVFASFTYFIFFYELDKSCEWIYNSAALIIALFPLFIWFVSYANYRIFTNANNEKNELAKQVYSKDEYKDVDFDNRKVFTKNYFTIIFLYLGLFGYIFSGVAWEKSESDKAYRSFGYYKNINVELSNAFKDNIVDKIISE